MTRAFLNDTDQVQPPATGKGSLEKAYWLIFFPRLFPQNLFIKWWSMGGGPGVEKWLLAVSLQAAGLDHWLGLG